MPRVLLTDAEREQRRKDRVAASLADGAYKHYNPRQEGYGSIEDWVRQAEALIGTKSILKTSKRSSLHDEDLATLYLEELPSDISDLKLAFRNTLMIVHPDKGGSNEATVALLAAFKRLSKLY